jgi:hypothetical protein
MDITQYSYAEGFYAGDNYTLSYMFARLYKQASPTDNLRVRIETSFEDSVTCNTNRYQGGNTAAILTYGKATGNYQKIAQNFVGLETITTRRLYLRTYAATGVPSD